MARYVPDWANTFKETFYRLIGTAPKPPGKPCQIIKYCPESECKIRLDKKEMKRILEKAEDRPIIILSACGRYRKGKSFLLNLLLRHLDIMESGDSIKYDGASLTGFAWEPGSKWVTNGLTIWDHPFLVTTQDGTKVALFVMDTHGLFDDQTPMDAAALLVSLSVLISSVQIYNIFENIGEDHLKSLELFATTASLAVEGTEGPPPFQRLVFLIRDWFSAMEYDYGATGGQTYLEDKLKGSSQKLVEVRENIKDAFQPIECFLMPFPGEKAARQPSRRETTSMREPFSGKFCDLSEDFRELLQELQNFLFDENKLKGDIKKVGGRMMNITSLFQHIVGCVSLFQEGKLPSPESTVQALLDQYNRPLLEQCMELFGCLLQEKFKDIPPDIMVIRRLIHECEEATIGEFLRLKKGSQTQVKSQKDALQNHMKIIGDLVVQHIEAKLLGIQEGVINSVFLEGKGEFVMEMSRICSDDGPYLKPDVFYEKFLCTKKKTLQMYEKKTRHLRSVGLQKNRMKDLQSYCDGNRELYEIKNKMRNPERMPSYAEIQKHYDLMAAEKSSTWKDIVIGILSLGTVPLAKFIYRKLTG